MKIALSALVALLLSACATPPAPKAPLQDSETAVLLTGALQRTEQLSKATASADAKPAPAVMSGNTLSVNFAGDAKDLLRQVAAARGLTYETRGAQPHLPLFVIVDVKNVTLEAFLTDVGSQLGQRAKLVLMNRSIEVRYSVQ